MKKLIAAVMALTLGASAATAGGPVVVEEEQEVVAERKGVGIVPLLLLGVVLCVALCGGDDSAE